MTVGSLSLTDALEHLDQRTQREGVDSSQNTQHHPQEASRGAVLHIDSTHIESPMFDVLSRSFLGWVDRTGLGHTVWWAGSYEVTPPEKGCVWEPTGHYEESTLRCVSRLLGQVGIPSNRGDFHYEEM